MIGNFKIKENSTHPMSLIVWEMMHLEMIKQDKQILIMKNKIFVLVKEMMYTCRYTWYNNIYLSNLKRTEETTKINTDFESKMN